MNLASYLIKNAKRFPDKCAYSFQYTNKHEEFMTYDELHKTVKSAAHHISKDCKKGDHVLLILEPGMTYIVSFWACLYSGVIPVPVYPPYPNDPNSFNRLLSIYKNSNAVAILTETSIVKRITQLGLKLLFATKMINIDEKESGADFDIIEKQPSDIAFLQYTSGSTSDPKGVIISHENLIDNCRFIEKTFGLDEDTVVCGWLPPYHDMGLIGGIIFNAFSGATAHGMSPLLFLKSPRNWLELITRHKAQATAGPDFSFSYCVKKVKNLEGLDLSSLRIIANGAEPIRKEVLDTFHDKFKEVGFKPNVFSPCYGLAEATLAVTVKPYGEQCKHIYCTPESLKRGKLVLKEKSDVCIVSTGVPVSQDVVAIYNVSKQRECSELEVGEISLLRENKSMSKGYYARNKDKDKDIQIGGRGYFGTGDLGTLFKGELYVTGRIKELIIINGKNYYPQDIEYALSEHLMELGYKTTAAVQIDGNKLGIVQELKNNIDIAEYEKKIKEIVWNECRLHVDKIKFLKKSKIPKTSSGKLQRYKCMQSFHDKEQSNLIQYILVMLRRYGILSSNVK
jgi:acyl-CoA synthetase (AMP-forming)/AMP-acid ligase II